MASLCRLGKCLMRNRCNPSLLRISTASISTSKKNKDTITISEPLKENSLESEEYKKLLETQSENWVSYGFDDREQVSDSTMMHLIFFFTITISLVWGGFYLAYMPDHRMLEWHHREAFLELRRREDEGLPLIDKNLVPLDRIKLPSDEKLEDTEIII